MQRGTQATTMARLGGLALTIVLLLVALSVPRAHAGTTELVMFEDAGCSWCRRFLAEIGSIYPRTEEGRRAPLRRLDISEATRSDLSLKARVTVTPTFVLVADGVEVGRITGYPGQDFFWGLLGELLGRLPAAPEVAPRLRDAGVTGHDAASGRLDRIVSAVHSPAIFGRR